MGNNSKIDCLERSENRKNVVRVEKCDDVRCRSCKTVKFKFGYAELYTNRTNKIRFRNIIFSKVLSAV